MHKDDKIASSELSKSSPALVFGKVNLTNKGGP